EIDLPEKVGVLRRVGEEERREADGDWRSGKGPSAEAEARVFQEAAYLIEHAVLSRACRRPLFTHDVGEGVGQEHGSGDGAGVRKQGPDMSGGRVGERRQWPQQEQGGGWIDEWVKWL